ncbi:MurR/RpiR family transcriptional regulator [Kribbella solani]|uniref:DNA-binding MurR/RpiR family transcriptional regulator n=1 Tax=Kribbella solani TaxID=236067 RepID=A0A841DL12_9ACTN|nr:SIS domain-containing protein [Kribbella solani]MBB5977117.1 DNA-binding MurR/RpiR family transcriptional regulator [Kribbella solani]MDX2969953.1 SIS domain-containing protein [Kribbella solani]MDX3002185.1 SIS domain-containing protein [Kribbella solani]
MPDDPRNRELASPQERYDARLQRRSSTLLQRRVVEQERASIDEALDQILADESIAQAAARIVAARRRFIIGSAKSYAYASLLAFDLGEGLSQVTLVDGTVVRGIDILADVRANDLMVAFSFRRYRRDTVDIARRFVEAGGELVAVTDFEDAPLAKLADQSIYVATGSASYVDSPTVVASVLHVLATLTTASAKGARRRLIERDRLNTELGMYVN